MRSGCTQDEACGSHGSCHMSSGTCKCTDGYTGRTCQVALTPGKFTLRPVSAIAHLCRDVICYTNRVTTTTTTMMI